jgi:PAS domain-containing protein
MDLSRLPLPDWLPLGLLSAVPESLVAAFVSAVATLALVGALAPRRASSARPSAPQALDPAACDFLIDGSSVKPLTEPARALIDSLAPAGPRLAALAGHLALDRPGIQAEIEALVLYGSGFRHHIVRSDGSAQEIVGEPRGGAAWLSIRPASEEARALRDTEAALDRATDELGFLALVLDRAPVMAWSQAPDGQIAWANRPYRDRFAASAGELPDHRIADGFGHVLEEVPLTARGDGLRRRVAVPGRGDDEPHWFEVCETPGPSGETLGFALEADDLVAAEASLRRFVETLTETFAHLPIGLAVFDKNRRLGLFNPALTDLVKIDAVWLAGRPSLRDFLERLRETRQMPEQKDFAAWRRKLSELEEGARDGTYEEHWQLPSGKIFRVTGRPHPQGALAFLFEDISTAIRLERRYRSELELSQATLDRLSEAVAVFDASGMLVFVNAAFEALWGLDPMQRLAGPTVAELTALWAERCGPSPAWARLAEFATAAEARTSWTATVETRDGARLAMLVAPLPDASALVVFREAAPATMPGALEALALDQLALPVEAAVQQLTAAIPTSASPDAFQALSAAAQGLKDGLARARELRALAGRPAEGALPELAAALADRGLALDAPADAWPAEFRRAALVLGLAAADLARPGASVALALDPERRTLTVRTAAAPSPRTEPVSLALARRLAEAAGGCLRQQATEDVVTLVAELPRPEAPDVALRA